MIHTYSRQVCDCTFEQFLQWATKQGEFMVDTETNVHHMWCERKLILIQFGNGRDEWLLQWSFLTGGQREEIHSILRDYRTKVLHNAYFDLVVLRFAGIVMRNVYCTMVAEMELNCGKLARDTEDDEDADNTQFGFYSLKSLLERYICLTISKEQQTSFGDDIITPEKVEYAAEDVRHLFKLRDMQMLRLYGEQLVYTCALDMACLPGLAEMTFHGMPLDKQKWLENEELAWPVVQHAEVDLELCMHQNPALIHKAKDMGLYSDEDRLVVNLNSRAHKVAILSMLFPDMPGATKAIIKRYLRITVIEDPLKRYALQCLEAGEEGEFLDYLQKHHRDFLVENNLMVPAGKFTINWSSQPQVLALFQVLQPSLTSLDKEAMAKFPFPIGIALKEYKDAKKLITTYGTTFIEKHVETDGCIRTNFNPIVSTGRLSSYGPNMQNIPSKESVGNRYRNAFVAEPGWVYVDSDYASQELVVIAYMSQDPVWLDALKNGKDLHSVCAEVVYKDDWKKAANPDCAYYAHNGAKCNCKKHKRLRTAVKTINFG